MLLPHMTADVYLGIRSHSPLLATFMIIVGALLAAEILTSTYTGLTSSNWGTFLRAEQPVGYWHSVTVSILIYLGMIAAAVFVPIAR